MASGGGSHYIVARYKPRGNVDGRFDRNVPRLLPTSLYTNILASIKGSFNKKIEKHLVDKTIKFSLTLFLGCGIGFVLKGLYLHGLSKSVYRSQSFCVPQYVGKGVELFSRQH